MSNRVWATLFGATLLSFGFAMPVWCQESGRVSVDETLGGSVLSGRVQLSSDGEYLIDDVHGRQVGANRFHSFDAFRVVDGEKAVFLSSDPGQPPIENVIARVTSGAETRIDGGMESRIDGASLFLINPAGLVFSDTARVDVSGTLVVTTADALGFDDGGSFDSWDPAPEVAGLDGTPSRFDFSGGSGGGRVVIDGSQIMARSGQLASGYYYTGDIVFAAENVELGESAILEAGEGAFRIDPVGLRLAEIRLAAVGAARAEVPLDVASFSASELAAELAATEGAELTADQVGGIVIGENLQVSVLTRGVGRGRLVIRAGALTVKPQSQSMEFGGVDPGVDAVNVEVFGELDLNEASLVAFDNSNEARQGTGDLTISAGSLSISEGSELRNDSRSQQDGGNIVVSSTDGINLAGEIRTRAFASTGDAGDVSVSSAAGINLEGGSIRSTSSTSGDAGDVLVDSAGDITLDRGVIRSTSSSTGDAGDVLVRSAASITLEGGRIRSTSLSTADTGAVVVEARGALRLSDADDDGRSGDPSDISEIVTLTQQEERVGEISASSGDAGFVLVSADRVELAEGARVGSIIGGSGNSSLVRVSAAQEIVIREDAQILNVTAQPLRVEDEMGGLDTDAVAATGNAGPVEVLSPRVVISSGGEITASTGGSGDAGNVSVEASELLEIVGRGVTGSSTGIFARSGFGVESQPFYPDGAVLGDAGDVTIAGHRIAISEGGEISTTALVLPENGSVGRAGPIEIHAADTIEVDGELGPSKISSEGITGSGSIELGARRIELRNGQISSSTLGSGSAGNIVLEGDLVRLSGDEAHVASVTLDEDGAGNAGSITVLGSQTVELSDGAQLSTLARGDGATGDIRISGLTVHLLENSIVLAGTQIDLGRDTDANTSNITIDGEREVVLRGTTISTQSDRPQSGSVTIEARDGFVYAGGGTRVEAVVRASESAAGDVRVSARRIALDRVDLISDATGAGSPAGSVSVSATAELFRSPSAVISAVSSDETIEDGVIEVSTPANEILGELVAAKPTLLDRSGELEQSCLARRSPAGTFRILGDSPRRRSPESRLTDEDGENATATSGEPCATP